MTTRVQQFFGEVFSLHQTENYSCTVRRFHYVQREWLLGDSVSLPQTPGQHVVSFEVTCDTNTLSAGLFLVIKTVSSSVNNLHLYECRRNPLHLVHLYTCTCAEATNARSYKLLSSEKLACICNGVLCIYSWSSEVFIKNPCKGMNLVDFLQAKLVLSRDLLVMQSNNNICTGIHIFLLEKTGNFCSISTRLFFPKEYISLVQSIYVRVIGIAGTVMIALQNNATCVCTNNKNFVVFVRGVVRYSCIIPFADVFSVFRHGNCFVLKSRQQGVCSVRQILGKIEVSHSWNEAKEALSGDFAGYGKKYLLLLRDREFSASSVVNLFGYEEGASSTSHVFTVINALQKRLHIAQNAVACAEDEFRQKQRLIDAIRWRVRSDPTLVATYPSRTRPMATVPAELPAVNITSFWNSTYRDIIIIGCTAQCRRKVEHLQMHLSVHDQKCEFVQNLCLQGCKAKIVTLGKLPSFLTSEVKVAATISWKTTDGCWHWKSFDTVIQVSEALLNRFLVPKGFKELEMMRLSQQKFLFHINGDQETILEKISSTPMLQHILVPEQPNIYAFVQEHLPLFGVSFQMDNSLLLIHARDNAQLMLFVHWFYSTVPEGVFLLPQRKNLALSCKNALRDELQLAGESVNITPGKYEEFHNSLLLQELATDRAFYDLLSYS